MLLVLIAFCPDAWAQESLDKRLFDRIYEIEAQGFRVAMRATDLSVFPILAGGPGVAWLTARRRGDEDGLRTAYRLAGSQAGALVATLGLKYTVRRTRPYRRFAEITSRGGDVARFDPYSFPSAHAALAFALVTSASLSYPHWYVVGPGYVWAAGVGLSRVWLGMHYPGDVLAGAVLGAAVATTVHLVAGGREDERSDPMLFQVRIMF